VNAWILGVVAMLPVARIHGAQPAPPNAELLEFLGSIDSDEEGWQEFLEQMPLKTARTSEGKPATKPVTKPAPKPAASPVAKAPPPPADDAGKVKSP
jgi:hypothetical protein